MTSANTSLAVNEHVILSEQDIERTLKRLAHELVEANKGVKDIMLVGIVTRGQHIATRLVSLLQELEGVQVPMGILDITLYRDDANQQFKPVKGSQMPADINGKTVILVDDVMFSGRTARAALDALNDYGRPSVVQLLVLLDRGHRELPISPNFVGKNIPSSKTERVNVRLMEQDGVDQVTIIRSDVR